MNRIFLLLILFSTHLEVLAQSNEFSSNLDKARKGNVVAQHLVAEAYRSGDGVEKSIEKSLYWYEKLVEGGDAFAMHEAANIWAFEKEASARDLQKGYDLWVKSAEGGCIGACFTLACFGFNDGAASVKRPDFGMDEFVYWHRRVIDHLFAGKAPHEMEPTLKLTPYMQKKEQEDLSSILGNYGNWYYEGRDFEWLKVERNPEYAVPYLLRAAELGNSWSQLLMGEIYSGMNNLVEPDDEKALYWYTLAAENGERIALCYMGDCYYGITPNRFVVPDKTKGLAYFRKAAEKGEPYAQYRLGYIYSEGDGTAVDKRKGYYWTKKAAENDFVEGIFNLSLCYLNGEGTEKNPSKYIECQRRAAEMGYPPAQFNMGVAYQGGDYGLPRNYQEAARWYRLAADQGDPYAQLNLGLLYFQGLGVKKSKATAKMLWQQSAAQGEEKAVQLLRKHF